MANSPNPCSYPHRYIWQVHIALAILKIIGYDLSLINFKAITKSMKILQQHDGSFIPTHIGAETDLRFVYCAAAISYMLDDWSGVDKEITKEYIQNCQRQAVDGGFQGRSNKASDTCYGFWVGGVLKILGGSKFIHKEALQKYLLSCQSKYSGFSKFRGDLPELYHSYYGFSAFSLLEGEAGLNSLCVELGITNRAACGG
ncbi:Geranylgeranyl transferase type-1 subunit beta-like protein [Drosera capensis]